MARSPIHRLSRYYRTLMLLGSFIFLSIVGLTVWVGWKQEEAVEIAIAQQRVDETAIRLQAMIKAANDTVSQAVSWANTFPQHAPYPGSAGLRRSVEQAIRQSEQGTFTLDQRGNLPAQERLGQLIGLNSVQQVDASHGVSHLDLAISLLDRMGSSQATSPFLRWTYFFSASEDLLALTPWASSAEMLGESPDIPTFLHSSWQNYDLTRMALPANNPQRQAFWTPAYLDQVGAGLMVSHAQPVYWGDDFVGVVAVDVLLNFLHEELRNFPDQDGTLLVANAYDQVLARRDQTIQSHSEITSLSTLLPMLSDTPDGVKQLGGSVQHDNLMLVDQLNNPHWTVLFLLPRNAITERVVASFMPQLLLALILVIGGALANIVLWRRFVAPTISVAEYVAKTADNTPPDPPEVPPLWRPWVAGMVQAFVERRRLFNDLAQANAELELKVAQRTQELMVANKQLTAQASTDPLTGAYNRRYLFELLSAEYARARRSAAAISVLLIDLDHFKRVNDNYGHDAGDAVLREFVERARNSVRSSDRICRYGGEEFVVLLPDCEAEGAMVLAERLRLSVAATPIQHAGHTILVTVSIGVAMLSSTDTEQSLLKRADQALYRAKNDGRNRSVLDMD
ncbi:hypothetical protein GCM10007421_08190 [Halopseudomonas oceani]|nr:sensor domain-containing diguanylate cyclase [Halopseudomonas oceani]GGE36685.1 hypothetical protein GCM10007421_08190 [Halopseudomonas oceani]